MKVENVRSYWKQFRCKSVALRENLGCHAAKLQFITCKVLAINGVKKTCACFVLIKFPDTFCGILNTRQSSDILPPLSLIHMPQTFSDMITDLGKWSIWNSFADRQSSLLHISKAHGFTFGAGNGTGI